MTIKNKVIHLDSQFIKELPTAADTIDSIYISGYASANSVDRSGDVIPSSVWEEGLKNYLKNPVVLAYHDHDDPIGRMVDHKVDEKGLWIKARISAASEVFSLVKDGVITAFSVGFRILDAEYNNVTELFIIKKLELLEISVVSVPCNQDTLFSLSKAFDSDNDYKAFKQQFSNGEESAKGLDDSTSGTVNKLKEYKMDPKDFEAAINKSAKDAAEAVLAAQKAEREAAEKSAREEAAMQERINKAVAAVTPSTTGAEKLMAEVEKRFAEQTESTKTILAGLESALKEKSAELAALQKSKMEFGEKGATKIDLADKEKAILLGKIMKKDATETKFGKALAEKALGAGAAVSPHLASQTWEHEVSLNMESEVRRRLIAAPLMRQIQMNTNVMSFPVNPEAGYGTWVTNAQFGTIDSSGAAQTHLLKEVTLNSYKLATKEYLTNEEEEDSLIVLLPIVRDAMIRRTAKSLDKALLVGVGNGTTDPIKGLAKYDDVSAVTAQVANKLTVALLMALRKDLGAWGLDPSEIVYIVNTEGYFDLLEDTTFQTMDKVGDRATLLTGMIGMATGSPVIVSSELPAKVAGANTAGNVANVGALAVNAANFLVGNQRGLRVESDDEIGNQRRLLVASMRMGMTQVTTNQGQGVSAFRWLV